MSDEKISKEREKEIKEHLQKIIDDFEPNNDVMSDDYNPYLVMFELVSTYNEKYDNKELIGGKWVREHGFDEDEVHPT